MDKLIINKYFEEKKSQTEIALELNVSKSKVSRAFRDWNPSIYKYNKKNKSYVLKKGINVGADVPRNIKWSN